MVNEDLIRRARAGLNVAAPAEVAARLQASGIAPEIAFLVVRAAQVIDEVPDEEPDWGVLYDQPNNDWH